MWHHNRALDREMEIMAKGFGRETSLDKMASQTSALSDEPFDADTGAGAGADTGTGAAAAAGGGADDDTDDDTGDDLDDVTEAEAERALVQLLPVHKYKYGKSIRYLNKAGDVVPSSPVTLQLQNFDVWFRHTRQRLRSYPKSAAGHQTAEARRVPLSQAVKMSIARTQGNICFYQSRVCADDHMMTGVMTIDHIDEDPSNNASSNLVACCWNCHRIKTMAFEQRKDYILRPLLHRCYMLRAGAGPISDPQQRPWVEPYNIRKYDFASRLQYLPPRNPNVFMRAAYSAHERQSHITESMIRIGEWKTAAGERVRQDNVCKITEGMVFEQCFDTGDGVLKMFNGVIGKQATKLTALPRFKPWAVEYNDGVHELLSQEDLLPYLCKTLAPTVATGDMVMKCGSIIVPLQYVPGVGSAVYPPPETVEPWVPCIAGRVVDVRQCVVEYADGTRIKLSNMELRRQRARFNLAYSAEMHTITAADKWPASDDQASALEF